MYVKLAQTDLIGFGYMLNTYSDQVLIIKRIYIYNVHENFDTLFQANTKRYQVQKICFLEKTIKNEVHNNL